MESFFQRHAYLLEHTDLSMTRPLMNDIDWKYRLIGIKGPRGVGKTTFLLQYAKKNYSFSVGRCLYINMNSFYFRGRGLVDFAQEFVRRGGRVLIVDQLFKQSGWREELCECYHTLPLLQIIFATTTVEEPGTENDELSKLAHFYVLHGFSFREYINMQAGFDMPRVTLDDILTKTEEVQKSILMKVRPWIFLQSYLHHGYYPFYIEKHNFTENLLKSINAMIEVDVLFTKQIDVKYVSRLKKLLYLLVLGGSESPNVSNLAKDINTSRATVMNYMNNLEEARLIHQIYKHSNTEGPKKPARVLTHNTNLLYAILSGAPSDQEVMETFFTNSIWRHHKVETTRKSGLYIIDDDKQVCVCDKNAKKRIKDPNVYYTRYNTEVARDNDIPIWMFGFLY
ncbi:MAG: ATP-binding protein [Bacteroidaceae bacterium]|nr:ATP-binding protein [Bacteroidaceae bacterium]